MNMVDTQLLNKFGRHVVTVIEDVCHVLSPSQSTAQSTVTSIMTTLLVSAEIEKKPGEHNALPTSFYIVVYKNLSRWQHNIIQTHSSVQWDSQYSAEHSMIQPEC